MKKDRLVFFLSLILIMGMVSCKENRTIKTMQDAGELAETHPDSALMIMKEIDPATITSEKGKAYYATILTHTQYLAYDPVCSDSLINADAEPYFSQGDDDKTRMLFFYLSGIFHSNKQEFSVALEKLLEAERIADGNRDYLYMGRIDRAIDDVYTSAWNVEKAAEYAEKSHECFEKSGNALLEKWSLLDVAHSYYNLRKYDECIVLCDSCIKIAEADGDAAFYEDIQRLKGYATIKDESIADTADLRTYLPGNLTLRDAYVLAQGYMNRSQPDSVKKYYEIIDKLTPSEGHAPVEKNQVMYYIAKNDGDYKKAMEALENVAQINADTTWKIFSRDLANTETNFRAEQTKMKEMAMQNLMITVSLVGLIIIICIVFAIMYHRKRLQMAEQEIERISLAVEKALTDFKKKEELTAAKVNAQLTEEYNRRREYFRKSFKDIEDLCYAFYRMPKNEEKAANTLEKVQEILKGYRDSEEVLSQLEQHVDFLYDGVASKFKQELPELYKKRGRLFLFVAMGFEMTTISVIMGKAIKTCYNRKSTLADEIRRSSAPDKSLFLEILT